MKINPTFNLQEIYKKYQNIIPNAKVGEVVTRFPPEPSGYLHIGHIKAALLNYHIAQIYKGQMVFRIDDTNPSKEKEEYIDSIIQDVKLIGLNWQKFSHTSDYFDLLRDKCEEMIKKGYAYCDNTPEEEMKAQRMEGIESKFRNSTPEQNLKIFRGMCGITDKIQNPEKAEDAADDPAEKPKKEKKEKKEKKPKKESKAADQQEEDIDYDSYCVRAKIDMQCLNKCMRDPVIYRVVDQPHPRTGNKFRVYPTYDFACPIVDSIEGVTHAMRTTEYNDRNPQYQWFIKQLNLRPVNIWEFSKLNFVNTCLSKRKLNWFVSTGMVEGWDDPRFPTIRGILRRGLQVETLIQFILEQGPSRQTTLMEWDKIWATNNSIIDPISPRYMAVKRDKICTLELTDGPELQCVSIPAHPKNQSLGKRPMFISKHIYLDYDDAKDIKIGEKITLVRWGNVVIDDVQPTETGIRFKGHTFLNDTDFKSTKKLTWLSKDSPLTEMVIVELDHLITEKKIEEDMNIEDIANKNSRFETLAYADPLIKNSQVGDVFQLERVGFFRVDKVKIDNCANRVVEAIYIPDGKQTYMSTLTTKVNIKDLSHGKGTKEEPKEEQKLSKKQKQELKKQKKQEKKAKKTNQTTPILKYHIGCPHGNMVRIVADICKFQYELKEKDKAADPQKKRHQIIKLKYADFKFTSPNAVVRYMASVQKNSKLLGKTPIEQAQVNQWLDTTLAELFTPISNIMDIVYGYKSVDKTIISENQQAIDELLCLLNTRVEGKKFIVGDELTLADIAICSYLAPYMFSQCDSKVKEKHPSFVEYYTQIMSIPAIEQYFGKVKYPQKSWI